MTAVSAVSSLAMGTQVWNVDTQEEWLAAKADSAHMELSDGLVTPTADAAVFTSVVKTFESPRRAKNLTMTQSPAWNNWRKIPSVKPDGVANAPIFLPVADGEYYFFACKGKGGYYAWRSADMKSWTCLGKVTGSHWATSAEYKDGAFYIYYDNPNDEDPHLIIDRDIMDGKLGENMGKVFADPSHGSDCGVFRDEDGTFHLIYEDWTPINAAKRSWDSPLAGHADSPDGIHGFEPHEHPPPVDERTTPTGEKRKFRHGGIQVCVFDVHKPEQDAYGDWTLIKVGAQYYLFSDYHPKEKDKSMRIGRWTSNNINGKFKWAGEIGENIHPDPTIGFAEGTFYLLVQNPTGEEVDFISPGPWVDGVEARAGVDTDGDGRIDQWTEWQHIKETYRKKPGFARVVEVSPAALDLASLRAGKGFQFAFRTRFPADATALPVVDKVIMAFE